MKHLIQRLRRGFLVALHSIVVRRCADCGCNIGQDNGPPDGWQLEDGRTVCHACCASDMGLIARRVIFMHNATAHVRAVASNVQQIVGNSGGDQ